MSSHVDDVRADTLGDIEIGSCVWSKTIRDSGDNPAGGVVVSIIINEGGEFEFGVLRRRIGGDFYVHVFDGSDIDPELATFYGQNARGAAASLHTWLGKQRGLQHGERAAWSTICAALDNVGITGLYLPHAHARYLAASAARRAERAS